jgi:ribonuclease HII
VRKPNLAQEKRIWQKGFVALGIDEAGRGAFAGPLTLAAVAFEKTGDKKRISFLENLGIRDSKKLLPKKRERLEKVIRREALFVGVSSVSVAFINRHGIKKATQFGIKKLVAKAKKKGLRPFLLIDGFYIKYLRGVGLKNQKGIVKGDNKVLSIAAASIVAKVWRDRYMQKLAKIYPQFGFEENKGYGTEAHRAMLKKQGPTPVHRQGWGEKVQSSKFKVKNLC